MKSCNEWKDGGASFHQCPSAHTDTTFPAAPAAPLFKSLGFFCAFPCPVPEPNAPILARAAPVGCNSRLFGAWNPSNGAFHGQDVDSSGLSTRPGVTGRPVSQWACMIISPSPAVPKRAQIHCRILACPRLVHLRKTIPFLLPESGLLPSRPVSGLLLLVVPKLVPIFPTFSLPSNRPLGQSFPPVKKTIRDTSARQTPSR
jgi:hypothetical protein